MSLNEQETGGAACPIFPKKGPRAIVLCDGPPPSPEVFAYWLAGTDLFVCTDAAGYPYEQLPRRPDVVIGDFDGIAGRLISGREGPRLLRVDEQETSDSEKALNYVSSQGLTEAVLVGATGWRLDHTLHNISLLERFADRLRLAIATPEADGVRLAPGEVVSWSLAPCTRFSLMPLLASSRGVTIEGADYPLLRGDLEPGGLTAISNRVAFDPLLIRNGDGPLLVLVDRDGSPPQTFHE